MLVLPLILWGIMLCFDDFIAGMDAYADKIQPLMECRQDRLAVAA